MEGIDHIHLSSMKKVEVCGKEMQYCFLYKSENPYYQKGVLVTEVGTVLKNQ